MVILQQVFLVVVVVVVVLVVVLVMSMCMAASIAFKLSFLKLFIIYLAENATTYNNYEYQLIIFPCSLVDTLLCIDHDEEYVSPNLSARLHSSPNHLRLAAVPFCR